MKKKHYLHSTIYFHIRTVEVDVWITQLAILIALSTFLLAESFLWPFNALIQSS